MSEEKSYRNTIKMLEKILEVFSSNDDLCNDENLVEIMSDLEKVKDKIHEFLVPHEIQKEIDNH